MSAVISPCGRYRYRLEREVQETGLVVALFGVNPSTADATVNDATIRKDIGFARRLGWKKIIKGNLFAYRATDVHELARAHDPIGPENLNHIARIILDADLLVPCWGSRNKLPTSIKHEYVEDFIRLLYSSGRPVRIFGLTKTGDPLHTLMLSYDTPLREWARRHLQ